MALTPQEAELRRQRIRQVAYGRPVMPPKPYPRATEVKPEPFAGSGRLNIILDIHETLLLTDAAGQVVAEITALHKTGRRARLAVRGPGITFDRVPPHIDHVDSQPTRNAG